VTTRLERSSLRTLASVMCVPVCPRSLGPMLALMCVCVCVSACVRLYAEGSAMADLADRSKPRRQFNYLANAAGSRRGAGPGSDEEVVRVPAPGDADAPGATRRQPRTPIVGPEVGRSPCPVLCICMCV
jgi:hypothetical protein